MGKGVSPEPETPKRSKLLEIRRTFAGTKSEIQKTVSEDLLKVLLFAYAALPYCVKGTSGLVGLV
eukprot:993723-Amphidinium_carterae.1